LGFGAMRLPMVDGKVDRDRAVEMIHRAFEAGVNYIDTAVGYCRGESQYVVGEALKGWRDRVVVSTKNPHYDKHDEKGWWKNLHDSLKRLDVECIDIYNFHGLNWERFQAHVAGKDGQLRWMRRAQEQGLIRHVCFSFHDTPDVLRKLAATDEFDVVTLQYNLLDQKNAEAFPALKKAKMGVVVMGPVGGGRLGAPSKALRKVLPGAESVPEIALRFVLSNPNVSVALSGMSEMAHVEENTRIACLSRPLSAGEKRRLQAVMRKYKKLADLYCTGCNYCMPCPNGVDIPGNFMLLNYVRVYDIPQAAKQRYRMLRGRATACVACGKCMSKCPQNIDIISQLRETIRTLDEAYGKMQATVKPTRVRRLVRRNGRLNIELQCRLECYNISDKPLRAELRFKPARGVSVEMSRKPGLLGPFARKSVGLNVKLVSSTCGPLRLGPSFDGAGEVIFSEEPLAVAIGVKGTPGRPEAALRRAPAVRAERLGGHHVPSTKARAGHSLRARFAYTDDEMVAEMEVAGRFPISAERRAGQAGELFLAVVPDVPGADMRRAGCYLTANIGGERSEPVHVKARFGHSDAGDVGAELSGGAKRRRLLLRIPRSLLKANRLRPGARFRVNFGVTFPGRNGNWSLRWSDLRHSRAYLILAD